MDPFSLGQCDLQPSVLSTQTAPADQKSPDEVEHKIAMTLLQHGGSCCGSGESSLAEILEGPFDPSDLGSSEDLNPSPNERKGW